MKETLNAKKLFNINKGDIISIVGTGGKTSLMFYLASELKHQFNVLVTTSTKILRPKNDMCDYLYCDIKSFLNCNTKAKNGITVISKSINEKTNKLIGIDDDELEKLINYFDIILIEADGSRNLPLKGWKSYEPKILLKTNKTIGVIPVSILGKKTKRDIIYEFEEFIKLMDNAISEYINEETIKKVCFHENGLFKNSRGKKHLFINQAENAGDIERAISLSKYINNNTEKLFFKIGFGSVKRGLFYED